MKRWMTVVLCIACCVLLAACGANNMRETEVFDVERISETEAMDLFTKELVSELSMSFKPPYYDNKRFDILFTTIARDDAKREYDVQGNYLIYMADGSPVRGGETGFEGTVSYSGELVFVTSIRKARFS